MIDRVVELPYRFESGGLTRHVNLELFTPDFLTWTYEENLTISTSTKVQDNFKIYRRCFEKAAPWILMRPYRIFYTVDVGCYGFCSMIKKFGTEKESKSC